MVVLLLVSAAIAMVASLVLWGRCSLVMLRSWGAPFVRLCAWRRRIRLLFNVSLLRRRRLFAFRRRTLLSLDRRRLNGWSTGRSANNLWLFLAPLLRLRDLALRSAFHLPFFRASKLSFILRLQLPLVVLPRHVQFV